MNKGYNKANKYERRLFETDSSLHPELKYRPCVFISHQKRDIEECKKVAKYLKDAGVDVYLDEYDRTLGELVAQGNSAGVTQRIQEGIQNSTHMLCVISPYTKDSYWVPFEIGYAYDRIDLASLTLRGIREGELPDYLKVKPIIRGIESLNVYVSKIKGRDLNRLIVEGSLKRNYDLDHPLKEVMDRFN